MKAMTERPKFTTIDDYLESASPEVKAILEEIRKIIWAEIPDAKETIGYQMPAFKFGRIYLTVCIASHDVSSSRVFFIMLDEAANVEKILSVW
jgi:hypothetical protein